MDITHLGNYYLDDGSTRVEISIAFLGKDTKILDSNLRLIESYPYMLIVREVKEGQSGN